MTSDQSVVGGADLVPGLLELLGHAGGAGVPVSELFDDDPRDASPPQRTGAGSGRW